MKLSRVGPEEKLFLHSRVGGQRSIAVLVGGAFPYPQLEMPYLPVIPSENEKY